LIKLCPPAQLDQAVFQTDNFVAFLPPFPHKCILLNNLQTVQEKKFHQPCYIFLESKVDLQGMDPTIDQKPLLHVD
jgi:hypothetical protein